ncbi:MAG: FMN-binding protein [Lachnospiraceae bacterium]|nr:FMN-binding protein [Lachnospiraceae bacterium]
MTDFKRLLATYAPLVPAAAVAAAVVIGLSGYETPTYAVTEYSAEESVIEETASKTVKQKEDKPAIGTGAFDVPDGTYQGSGTGFGGTVTVSVTIREKTITAVDILSHSDTPSFFSRAEAQVVAAILAEQKADVDAVSGATLSSNGIMQAVRNALHTAAGEETEALAEASGMPRRKPSPALLREVAHGQ